MAIRAAQPAIKNASPQGHESALAPTPIGCDLLERLAKLRLLHQTQRAANSVRSRGEPKSQKPQAVCLRKPQPRLSDGSSASRWPMSYEGQGPDWKGVRAGGRLLEPWTLPKYPSSKGTLQMQRPRRKTKSSRYVILLCYQCVVHPLQLDTSLTRVAT